MVIETINLNLFHAILIILSLIRIHMHDVILLRYKVYLGVSVHVQLHTKH